MEAKIQKWGNSSGIRLPKKMLESLNMHDGTPVDVISENNKIIITKKKKKTIKELFENYDGDTKMKEYDWGEPEGREIW